MDPDNPIVRLCVAGVAAETAGENQSARSLFEQAWTEAQDDFEACIAAHYVARHQEHPEEILHWNQEALRRAEAVGDERVTGFYASLYLNLGWSYEMLGDEAAAQHYYGMAGTATETLPEGAYRQLVQRGIGFGKRRVSFAEENTAENSAKPPKT